MLSHLAEEAQNLCAQILAN